MYAGQVAEQGTAARVLESPQHPYTWGLLRSMPRLERSRQDRLNAIPGSPPSLVDVPAGCPFRARCQYDTHTNDLAATTRPVLRQVGPDHWSACHLDDDVRSRIFLEEVKSSL
jgi:peptide/nickel transport system ATP-binding protein